jgi:hypothetical protein
MYRLYTYALAITCCLGASAVLVPRDKGTPQRQSNEAQMADDGAFRDGLYLGKLARREGGPRHAAVGRWSSAKDRAAFLSGYQRGFDSPNPPK